ncbi:MAG: hypothetical protein GWN67_20055 [Phycisphaerae bacterium]|nr:hypothetical protein [Phycisphaerae bacterium]NIP54409.1 hypothetical protein [Phycisphaerae bacterium]NIS53268.1 hypothetical protein [Phycisphaerae bacterium]NIU10794.1 hypothetical protein [Phycisphaerae bacterium]NIU58589.1 hypothetical protein [Phycisphaerae bacterium]
MSRKRLFAIVLLKAVLMALVVWLVLSLFTKWLFPEVTDPMSESRIARYIIRIIVGLLSIGAGILKGFRDWTRPLLKRFLKEVVSDYKSRPYEYWDTVTLPITFEKVFEGKEVQAEINMLESEAEYRHISISVDEGFLFGYCPIGTSFIIHKDDRED